MTSAVVVDAALVQILGDIKSLQSALKQAIFLNNGAAGKVERRWAAAAAKMQSIGNSLSAVGGKMSLFFSVPIAAATGGLIKLGADAEELESQFQQVFQSSAAETSKWAKQFGNDVGRSSLELMEMAASAQDTFVPLGFARDKAANMSTALSELAVDVASFKNASDTRVMENFQSALVGNHEAVRSYGIVITETTLKQELQRIGAGKLTGAALEQAKVQARLNLIMKNTSDAHGDAAKTADSATNKTKKLVGQLKDQAAELGDRLLPLYVKVVDWGLKLVNAFGSLDQATQLMMVSAAGLVAAAGPLISILGFVASAIGVLMTPIGIVGLGIAALATAFVLFNEELEAAIRPVGAFFSKWLVEPIKKTLDWLREKLGGFWADQAQIMSNIMGFVGFDDMSARMSGMAESLQQWADGEVSVFETVADAASSAAGKGVEVVKGRFNELFDGLKSQVGDFFELPNAEATSHTSVTQPIVKAGERSAEKVTTEFSKSALKIENRFVDLADGVNGVFTNIGNSLKRSILAPLNEIANDLIGGATSSLLGFLPGFASGGLAAPGVPTLVGERGPELVTFSRAATVMNAGDTRSVMGQGAPKIDQHLHFDLVPEPTISAMIDQKLPAIEQHAAAYVLSVLNGRG